MLNEELIKKLLLEKPKFEKGYIERDIKLVKIKKIFTIIGPRRVGKTYFLYQIIDNLLKHGIDKNRILYINFEDERLENLKVEDLQKIIETYFTLYPENKDKKVYLMFDEIQNVPLWPKFIRRLYDKENCEIYVTGSSAKLLSKEIATELRGRTWIYQMYPFSFKEFLDSKKIKIGKNSIHSEERFKIAHLFEEYLKIGGFPEAIMLNNYERRILLQNYFETVLFRDIVERNKITNIELVRNILILLINNFSRPFSINKLYYTLKSQNRAVSKDWLYQLINYIEDTLYFFFVHIYSESAKKRMMNPKKGFVIDNGLIDSIITSKEEIGWLYENLVAIELKRRGYDLFYYSDKNECDFIAINKIKKETLSIQVTLNTDKEREIQGLLEALERTNSKKGLLINKTEDKTLKIGKKEIIFIPLWKWLLIS